MDDRKKTKNRLIDDLSLLRQCLSDLERSAADNERRMKELQESEERYRTIVETTNTGYVIVDSSGLVIDANAEYVRMTGYCNLSDILGRSVLEWTAQHEKAKNEAAIRKCVQEGHIRNFEIDYVDMRGNITPVEINATVVDPDKIPRIITICHDITVRKRASQELHESENRLRMITDNARDVIWMMDMNLNFTFLSSSINQMLGYTEEEYLTVPHEDIIGSSTYKKLRNIFLEELAVENMQDKDIYRYRIVETEQIKRDGSKIWVEIKLSFIRDAEGRPIGILGFSRDITERKRAEETLRQSEEKYRTILENISDGYYEVDLAGNFTFFNDALRQIYAYPKEELLGLNYRRYTNQQTADSLFQAYNNVYRHGGPGRIFDYEVTRKNGEKRYVEVAFSLRKDASGKTIGFGGITRDITGRKQMAEALKDSENRLNTILEANPTGIILVEKQTRTIAYVNQSAAKMIGLPSETIVGRVCHRFICQADINRCPIYDLGLAIDYAEKNMLRQDGSSLTTLKAAAEISLGGVKYLLESFIDISKQKQTENERQKLEERLLRAEKMESLGTLAGGVAHDLNNVLGVLVGYSELLLEKIPPAIQLENMLPTFWLPVKKVPPSSRIFNSGPSRCFGFRSHKPE